MSSHVLLNFLNKLGKKSDVRLCRASNQVFPNKFNKFNNTGAKMQDCVNHMTLKSHFISKFRAKTLQFRL